MNIWVFGASIVYGAWDTSGGWVQRLRTYLDTKGLEEKGRYYREVYNLGVPKGETTNDLKNRILSDAIPRRWDAERVTMISIGINDSALWHKKGGNWVSIEQYRENLREIAKIAQQFSKKVVFVGLTQVDESRTVPIAWDTRFSYKNLEIIKYNRAMKEVAREMRSDFIDLLPALKASDFDKMLVDGVHPNNEGHQKIFEIIKFELEKLKII